MQDSAATWGDAVSLLVLLTAGAIVLCMGWKIETVDERMGRDGHGELGQRRSKI